MPVAQPGESHGGWGGGAPTLLALGFLGADSETRCQQLFSEASPGTRQEGGAGRPGRKGSPSGQRRTQGHLVTAAGVVAGLLPSSHFCQLQPLGDTRASPKCFSPMNRQSRHFSAGHFCVVTRWFPQLSAPLTFPSFS